MELSKYLKKARENVGLSQAEVAEKLNISRQAISKWENGWTSPDIDNLVILSDLYDVSLDELIKNDEKKKDEDLQESVEPDKKKVFGLLPEEVGILIAIVCLSTIPCLGLVGIILLLGYCVFKKYKIGAIYKVIILCFILISIYNSVVYVRIEFMDLGVATIEKVASVNELYFRNL